DVSRHGLCSQSASQHDTEPPLLLAIHRSDSRDKPKVLPEGKSGIPGTGRKTKFELPAKLLADGITEEIGERSVGVRRHVERFVGVDTRFGRCRDIAHRIAAGLTYRYIIRCQLCPQLGSAVQAHKVDLDVLPCGEVQVTDG